MRVQTEIKLQIRRTRKEMKERGIKRISRFFGGLTGEAYSLNARMFLLETELKAAQKCEDKNGTKCYREAQS
jgi:hypothetical protein